MRLSGNAVKLLQALVRTPSPSREEDRTAGLLVDFLAAQGVVDIHRTGNNVWARNLCFDPEKPTILLCSHHDTVRAGEGWTRDPFDGAIENGRLYGLGSNDAGASLVSLTAAFLHFYERKDLTHNLLLALVAQEEISGAGGARSLWPEVGLSVKNELQIPPGRLREETTQGWQNARWAAIVGEPTGMRMATVEMGLMVLDCTANGRAGHAARNEGDNAIYRAIEDIAWFRAFGAAKMTVTIINAGTQHNVVPAECRFTVDVRVPGGLSNEELLETVRANVRSEVVPRSVHLRSSKIAEDHPLVEAARGLGIETFESPTTSDQVTLDIPSVKIGPGESARSHTADEYVELAEIERGIKTYIRLIDEVMV